MREYGPGDEHRSGALGPVWEDPRDRLRRPAPPGSATAASQPRSAAPPPGPRTNVPIRDGDGRIPSADPRLTTPGGPPPSPGLPQPRACASPGLPPGSPGGLTASNAAPRAAANAGPDLWPGHRRGPAPDYRSPYRRDPAPDYRPGPGPAYRPDRPPGRPMGARCLPAARWGRRVRRPPTVRRQAAGAGPRSYGAGCAASPSSWHWAPS